MTREEEIEKEAYRQEELVNIDAESFIEGAKWADSNSKSPWISVNEKGAMFAFAYSVTSNNTERRTDHGSDN